MSPTRKLALKRDVLLELTSDQLGDVVAGTKTVFDTMYSCLPYESCRCVLTINPACF